MARSLPPFSLVPLIAALVVSVGFTTSLALWWERPDGVPEIRDGAMLVLDREALAQVDLEKVHTELVPNWVVAVGGVKQLHWDRLSREAGRDKNLGALLDRMALLMDADPVLNAMELLALVRAWNDYLEKGGHPWRLAGEVVVGEGGGTWRLKSYRVLMEDGRVTVGERTFGASVRRRVDATSLVDGWMGHVHSHEEGVVILLDRVTSFALDRVWPMLDPVLDGELDALQQTFAPAVRAEVAEVLSPEALTALRNTAEDRMWLIRAAASVHSRHRCGSQFLISRVPWNGMSPRDQATLQQYAAGKDDHPCPDVTQAEALVFMTRSHHLRREPGVREALGRLVAWVASAVAVHEARHAADVAEVGDGQLPCLGCPDDTTRVAVLEGSAYVASFAHAGSAAVSLFQACGLDPEVVPDRAAIVRFVADSLYPGGCDAAPPDDLVQRAQVLERRMFSRTAPIELGGFPASLPVSSEYLSP
ncbi:MAG: hypothetical protein KTR31_11835 [Myxococcales bacterium]|nr:hypothetical protein [Myxococcales bacterium]